MCGIAGFTQLGAKKRDFFVTTARKMGKVLTHRGPDNEGIWTDPESGIALSHRRLSIVDLNPSGNQPMISACSRWVISYNGEIYNTDELRNQLLASGSSFRGTSDTEVILEGCAHWGIQETANRLIGMFAFAIWDRQQRTLNIVRDRLGIKPVYWSFNNGTLLFASELKALRQHPDCPTTISHNVIASYLRNGYINAPDSIYQGVHKLGAGSILTQHHNQTPVTHCYWTLHGVVATARNSPFQGSALDAIDELDYLLRDAVRRRMVADVPLGAFLSGGIDSSSVVALMQAQSNTPINTFSIGFEEAAFDESPYAAAVARHLGTNHLNQVVSAEDALKVIPELPTLYDEPFSDPSQIPTFLLSKLTKQHVTVALSGDGGDELFAGYDRYFKFRQYEKLLRQPKLARNIQAVIIEQLATLIEGPGGHLLPAKFRKKLQGGKSRSLPPLLRSGSDIALYRRLMSRTLFPEEILLSGQEQTTTPWSSAQNQHFDDPVEMMQYIDTLDYLPDDILTKVDRASMATSLEARVPLIDHRVVEFAWRLPMHFKAPAPKKNKQASGKWILKQVLQQYVPNSLIDRPKAGFTLPVGQWLRGPLQDWAEDLLSEESLRRTEIFQADKIRQTWRDHQSGKMNHEYHLWDVLMLQAWMSRHQGLATSR